MAEAAGDWIAAEKYTSEPSGENPSGVSDAELEVRRRAAPPAASITKISKFP